MKLLKGLSVLLLLAGAAAGYFYFAKPNTEKQVHYLTENVQRHNLDKSVLATGSVRAVKRIEVGAQVSGKIQKIYVSLGQKVKRGELLAEIDSSNQQNKLNTTQAQLSVYKAQLNSNQVALEVAQSNYNRMNKLYQQKSASQTELETAKNTLAAAKAAVEQSQAQIKSAEISVNDERVNMGYTKITSPISGIVVSIPMTEGQTVNANQTSPTIVQVANLDRMLIKMEIAEGDIDQVKTGQKVTFSTLSDPNRTYEGEIDSIDPALTTLTDNSYSETSGNTSAIYYYANVIVPNEDQSLRIGMTTQSKVLIAERKDVLAVPTSVLKKRGEQTFVQVLENNQPVEKEVETGLADSQYTEIISGLQENEKVIMTQRASDEKVGGTQPRMRF